MASISLFCCSYIIVCSFILSSLETSDFVICSNDSLGLVTPCKTFPNAGFITDAAPNNNLPTVVSLNCFYSLLIIYAFLYASAFNL